MDSLAIEFGVGGTTVGVSSGKMLTLMVGSGAGLEGVGKVGVTVLMPGDGMRDVGGEADTAVARPVGDGCDVGFRSAAVYLCRSLLAMPLECS